VRGQDEARRSVLVLLFLAPVLGELVSGHQRPAEFFNPISFAATALPYGCGALLCREFTRRWRKGWLSLLLLGVAYGLYEEGVVSRALFDPQWHELEAIGRYTHVAGINWTYGILLIHFHAAISILSSVMLAELLFPERRHEPWLTNRQAALCGLVLALWAPVLAWLARADHPLYLPAPALWALTTLVLVGLVATARLVTDRPLPIVDRRVPHPRRFLVLGAVNMTVVFATVFVLPEQGIQPPLIVLAAFLLASDGVTLWLLLRWSGNTYGWDDRHRLALVAGLLAFFVLFGVVSDLELFEGKSLVALATVLALWRLRRRVGERERLSS
jgi:hypothetical protein